MSQPTIDPIEESTVKEVVETLPTLKGVPAPSVEVRHCLSQSPFVIHEQTRTIGNAKMDANSCETYKVRRGTGAKRLLEPDRSSAMCFEGLYKNEEDGYTGRWASDKSFQLFSGEMQITMVDLVAPPEAERTLVSFPRIPLEVRLHKCGIDPVRRAEFWPFRTVHRDEQGLGSY